MAEWIQEMLETTDERFEALPEWLKEGYNFSGEKEHRSEEQEVNAQSFNFKLVDWQKKGEGIIFEILVTSDQDTWLSLYPNHSQERRTRVLDDFGNEYITSKIQFGSFSSTKYGFDNKLVAEVPMRLIISFDNFSPQTKIIPLLEISCRLNNKDFSAQLRDIPITE